MFVVYSRAGVPIRLTPERWRHIVANHPEMSSLQERVLETVAGPDCIQTGDFGELLAVRRYSETPFAGKYMVVVYREVGLEDGFVLTAYVTRRPSTKRTLMWKR